MPNLIIIFLTGLLSGGITCAAVQGGLLATLLITSQSETQTHGRFRLIMIVLTFVGAKLISHTILGFLLGLMGEKLQFSVQLTAFMLGIVSFFMIGMALNMLSVHPLFHRFVIAPPKFFRRLIWKQSKQTNLFAPIFLGALTIFIPCGTTQAMMAQAIASGKPITGAFILFSFILGTIPLFILLGLAITTMTEMYKQWFQKIAAVFIIGMALWNLSNVSVIFGLDKNFRRAIEPIWCQFVYCEGSRQLPAVNHQTTQSPTVTIQQASYEVDNQYIPGGKEITLTVTNKAGVGCIQYFTIPSLRIQKAVPVGTTEKITFTAPTEKGELAFSCSMGMYRGKFIVE